MVQTATECVYNPKQKPGLKPGAVEALTRRVGKLLVYVRRDLLLTPDSISRANTTR